MAVKWQEMFPRFLQYGKEKTDAEFIDELKGSRNFLGVNGRPQVFVQALPINERVYSGHLYCDRKADPDLAVMTILYAKHYLFAQDVDTIVAMVHTRHRTLQNIILRSGFYSTGLFMWKGADRNGKVLETEQFIVKRGKLH